MKKQLTMNPKIINKLRLRPTQYLVGQSFANAIQVFSFEDGILVAHCDHSGQPTPGKLMFWTRSAWVAYDEAYILAASYKAIKACLECNLKIFLKGDKNMDNQEYYEQCKLLVINGLENIDWENDHIDVELLSKEYLKMIQVYADKEDYEAARAVKDGLREFLNNHGHNIPKDATVKL